MSLVRSRLHLGIYDIVLDLYPGRIFVSPVLRKVASLLTVMSIDPKAFIRAAISTSI